MKTFSSQPNLNTFFIQLAVTPPRRPLPAFLRMSYLNQAILNHIAECAKDFAMRYYQEATRALENQQLAPSVELFEKAKHLTLLAQGIERNL